MIGVGRGTVCAVRGGLIEVRMPALGIGDGAWILTRGGRAVSARAVAADRDRVTFAPLTGADGVAVGDPVEADPGALDVARGTAVLGRGIDGIGAPLDGGCAPARRRSERSRRPLPGERAPVATPCWTGVPAIDGPLAFGVGARIGVFGAPGCGKSTLLETMASGTSADAVVVGLVGERGREAERWLRRIDRRTTLVCATSDRSAAERLRAAEVAFEQAEALRRRGLDVLLVVDSLARVAAAAREIALAAGEPVGRGGYPPSVFATVAALLERAGRFTVGSVTLVATILAEGADLRDPVGEACRAALDGHLVLSERLAAQGWFPAIDQSGSTSRTFVDVADAGQAAAARTIRAAIALLDELRDARLAGIDPAAASPAAARAIAAEPALAEFLQRRGPVAPLETLTGLRSLADRMER